MHDLANVIERTHATIDAEVLPTVMCDRIQIQRVFQNVISNALKYCPAERSPIINIGSTVGPAPDGPGATLIEINVTDNGIGFEERHAERIFEPFQRLHSSDDFEGSGIGLAICRKIMDRHGGSIRATSRPGQGSVFSFTLPMR